MNLRAFAIALVLVGFAFSPLWVPPATAQGTPPVTFFPASSVSFANQVINTTSSAKPVMLTNNQSVPLNVTSVTASGNFAATNCATPVAPGKSCTISVTFTPTAVGSTKGTLTVTDDASTSPQTLSLSGTGVLSVYLQPTILQFPTQVVGTSTTKTVILANNQPIPLNVYSIATTGPFAATTCPSSIPPSGTCVISITFTPTAIYQVSGTLTVTDGVSSSPQKVTLYGTGSAVQLTAITVTPTNPSGPAGATQQFTATGSYNNGTNADLTKSVAWASSAAGVATLNASGLASLLAAGAATITASSGTVSGSALLTVNPPALVSIALTPPNSTVAPGATKQITATGTYTDGSTQNLTNSVSWSSTNPAAATISATGLATGVATGATTISAGSGTIVGTTGLTVGNPPTLVSIAALPASGPIALSTSELFTATGTYSDGSTQNLTGAAVTWSVGGVAGGNSTLGTISSLGLYMAPATLPTPALETITATSTASSTVSGSATATVVQISVTVTPTTAQVPGGATQQFTASVNGPPNTAVTWSVGGISGGNSMLGTISNAGLYTAPATVPTPPQVNVTATSSDDGVTSASATVTVTVPIAVTVTPSTTQRVIRSQTLQFTATVTGSANKSVIWSVGDIVGGNSIVGTISSSGLYTAPVWVPYPSLLSIIATSVADPTKTATGGVRVVPPTSGVSLTISPVSLWVEPGESWPFFAKTIGTSNVSATFSVNGVVGGNSTFGTISTSGVYTAPSVVPNPPQVIVTVTTVADPSKSAIGTVTIANTPFSATPLVDFTPGALYLNQFSGLLYNGSNSPPPDHDAVGLTAAAAVQPLDVNGNPSPTGKIVLTSLGMSETQDDWCFSVTQCTTYSFMGQAAASTAVNHTTLVIIDGAQSGANAAQWICAYGNCPAGDPYPNKFDWVRDNALTPAGLSEAQVQVVWIQGADLNPTWFPSLPSVGADAYAMEYNLGETVRALKVRWPNVKEVFFSSRLYAGYTITNQSPEPYAYEYGYSVKWLINAQITQRETSAVDPLAGDMLSATPWVAWGPYLWGNGTNNIPGSLALNWAPIDFVVSDLMHPSATGVTQVAGTLMNFFLTSPYTPWFRQ